jgi:DNA-binding transcriptional ArsR family regulator
MSRHLRALRQSGLVEESHPEFDARVRVYACARADGRAEGLAGGGRGPVGRPALGLKAHVEGGRMSSKILVALRIAAPPLRVFEAFTADIGAVVAAQRPVLVHPALARRHGLRGRTAWSSACRPARCSRSARSASGSAASGWCSAGARPASRRTWTPRSRSASNRGDGTRVTVEHRGWDTVPRRTWRGMASRTRSSCSATASGGARCCGSCEPGEQRPTRKRRGGRRMTKAIGATDRPRWASSSSPRCMDVLSLGVMIPVLPDLVKRSAAATRPWRPTGWCCSPPPGA